MHFTHVNSLLNFNNSGFDFFCNLQMKILSSESLGVRWESTVKGIAIYGFIKAKVFECKYYNDASILCTEFVQSTDVYALDI